MSQSLFNFAVVENGILITFHNDVGPWQIHCPQVSIEDALATTVEMLKAIKLAKNWHTEDENILRFMIVDLIDLQLPRE